MYKKLLASGITASMLIVGSGMQAYADEDNQENTQVEQQEKGNEYQNADGSKSQKELKDEMVLKHKLFIGGADLNKDAREQTEDKLGVTKGFVDYTVSREDVERYTGGQYDYIHSSASIVPKKYKKGVDVEIKTPENITRITKEQYINAAITSGIKNATIEIASVDKVSGEGALAGIYKGLEEEGIEIDEDDIKASNTEMDSLADITEENEDIDGYSDEALNNAVVEMKEKVADEKKDGKDITDSRIQEIVNESLKNNGLDDKLNENQKNKIVNIVINVASSNVITKDPDAYKEQTSKYQDMLKKKSGKALDKAKELNTDENKEKAKGFFAKLKEAVSNLFSRIFGS